MTTKTLQGTEDRIREWESSYGPMRTITLIFNDGTKGEVNTKPDSVDKRLAEFRAVVGKEGEYVLEDGGKWNDGKPKPFKVKEWPGKPQGKGSGGGGGFKGLGFDERFRLDAYQQERMDRRTAVMQAVTLNPGSVAEICAAADVLYEWLRETAGITPVSLPSGDPAQGAGSDTPLPRPPSSSVPTHAGADAGRGPAPAAAASAATAGRDSSSGEEESAYDNKVPAKGQAASRVFQSASSPEPTSEEVGAGLGKGTKPTSSDPCQWGPAPSGNKRIKYCAVHDHAEKV